MFSHSEQSPLFLLKRGDGVEESHTIIMEEEKEYYTYIMMNKWDTVSYIGITGNLLGRILSHKQKINKGFTEKYNINKLVYYETFDNPGDAIARKKQLKRWTKKEGWIN